MRNLSDIVNNEALEYAMYTLSSRAIPNMIDGFKPVQRFFMYSAINQCKGKFVKVASIGGSVSGAGYAHGESSASDAGQLMANTWNNNIPVLTGDGNFGSRLVQEAAAPRYTFCKPSPEFFEIYRDMDVCSVHSDYEHLPPAYYLPIIPMVLANGVRGIATGFATHIFPHSKESLVDCTIKAIKGEEFAPVVSFPEFTGKVVQHGGGSISVEGTYTLHSKTKLDITEIPVKYDRESYVKVLDLLEETGRIVSYSDRCGENGFKFEVTLKRDFFQDDMDEARHEQIMRDFGLIQKMTQNITVIDENGKLKIFKEARELISHFVQVRMGFVEKRISQNINQAMKQMQLAIAKAMFIQKVINEEIVVKGMTKKQLVSLLGTYSEFHGHEDKLVAMNVYQMTTDEVEKLNKEVMAQRKEYDYWTKTTPKKEYMKDLKAI